MKTTGLGKLSRAQRITLSLVVFMLAGASINVVAQQGAETTPAGTLTSNSELVLVPVQVKRAGKPLRGLTQNDFVLRSDGKMQPIEVFEESSGQPVGGDAIVKPATPSAGVQEFSNLPVGGMPEHLLIIAVDWVNSPYAEQAWAQQGLLKYFAKDQPKQPFALVAFTEDGLVQIHPSSSDPAALQAAIREAHSQLGKAERRAMTARELLEKQTGLTLKSEAADRESVEAKAIDATMLSFVQLEKVYGGVPGRKSLVWLADRMPDLPAIAAILNRGNIALYPVSVGGALADPHYLADLTAPATPGSFGTGDISSSPEQSNAMRDLASRTGGRFCPATTALNSCIEQAVADSTDYYLLGFYVSQQDRKPGWHNLQVKLASQKAEVYARSGYYLEPRTVPTENEIRNDLIAAANTKLDYNGVVFSVERLADSTVLPAATLSFRIHVPSSSVLLPSGRRSLSYEIAMIVLSEKGEPTATAKTVHLDLNAEQTDSALTHGWRYDETLPKPGLATAVRFIIRDNGSGNIGSVVVPAVVVPR